MSRAATSRATLHALQVRARQLRGADSVLHLIPLLAVPIAFITRDGVSLPWTALVATLLAVTGWRAWHAMRGLDQQWLARRLDASRDDMEDSASLLFAPESSDIGLQSLQRARLHERIASTPFDTLRAATQPVIHWRTVLLSWLVAAALAVAITAWPMSKTTMVEPVLRSTATGTRGAPPSVVAHSIRIQPPGYTNLPARMVNTWVAEVPAGSTLRWQLDFSSDPPTATLEFHDGTRVPLRKDNGHWVASRRLDRTMLYRVVLPTPLPASQSVLHRIDVVIDQPPTLHVMQPTQTLSMHVPGQRQWKLAFEAEDDHGIAMSAKMLVSVTQGDGENITSSERSTRLRGTGNARTRRYMHVLDPSTMGLAPGSDLIVQFEVSDNRAPQPQSTRSASYILRWPPEEASLATGLEGLVKKTMPAYFRSQRQIIIDAEALQKQKRSLATPDFLRKSESIGIDQHSLRLRYGQFLGEESEGAPLLPTNDADDDVGSHANDEHVAHDEHPSPAASQAPTFGEIADATAQFGHAHDLPEAATLLDPETKTVLREALDQMWLSEGSLRQGRPDTALPYANKALVLIKKVQQATRIYLARTGTELPAIDPGRRLGGDRTGLADRSDPLLPAATTDITPTTAWLALQHAATMDDPDGDSAAGRLVSTLSTLESWAARQSRSDADPFDLLIAIDAMQAAPDCLRCRDQLLAALWPLMHAPTVSVTRRGDMDAEAQAYFKALDAGPGDARATGDAAPGTGESH